MRSFRILIAALVAAVAVSAMPSAVSAQSDARIHLIHGIPGVDVDVEAGGDNVFTDFSFSDTQDLGALAGATLEGLRVKVAGTDDIVIDAGDVTLPSDGNTTILAHLTADGVPTLTIFDNDISTIDAGNGRLVVRHAAAAPLVDIRANGSVAFANVPNGGQGAVDLAAGTVTAEVVPAGADTPVVIGPADLPINEGESLIVYAVGSLDDDSLTVLTETITGLHSTPSRVDTGNSPIETGSNTALYLLAGVAGISLVGVTRRRFASIEV